MEHWLATLPDDGTLPESRDGDGWNVGDWRDGLDLLFEFAPGTYRAWQSPDSWLAGHESRQLDWGCVIYAASKEDVERFASAEPLDHQKEAAERQARMIEALDPDARYGIVFVKMS